MGLSIESLGVLLYIVCLLCDTSFSIKVFKLLLISVFCADHINHYSVVCNTCNAHAVEQNVLSTTKHTTVAGCFECQLVLTSEAFLIFLLNKNNFINLFRTDAAGDGFLDGFLTSDWTNKYPSYVRYKVPSPLFLIVQ